MSKEPKVNKQLTKSFRCNDRTAYQIDMLAILHKKSHSEAIIDCINRIYHQDKERLNAQKEMVWYETAGTKNHSK